MTFVVFAFRQPKPTNKHECVHTNKLYITKSMTNAQSDVKSICLGQTKDH